MTTLTVNLVDTHNDFFFISGWLCTPDTREYSFSAMKISRAVLFMRTELGDDDVFKIEYYEKGTWKELGKVTGREKRKTIDVTKKVAPLTKLKYRYCLYLANWVFYLSCIKSYADLTLDYELLEPGGGVDGQPWTGEQWFGEAGLGEMAGMMNFMMQFMMMFMMMSMMMTMMTTMMEMGGE